MTESLENSTFASRAKAQHPAVESETKAVADDAEAVENKAVAKKTTTRKRKA